LRVVFAGTPPFAARALAALHEAGHDIPLVLTQPDRPAGRGLRPTRSAVAEWARARGLPTSTPASLKDSAAVAELRAAAPDVMVVAAYGLLLPEDVLRIPQHGCLNIHASLLPRWRGAAPIQRAILAGDPETGVCIMRMERGLDTGPILLETRIPIRDCDTAGTLTATLADAGAQLIAKALDALPQLQARPQDSTAATYARKVEKSEAVIDWARPAFEIGRQVRAFNPAPGAETRLNGEALKIWEAETVPGTGHPGQVLRARNTELVVGCGQEALQIRVLQRAGARRLEVADFLRGTPLEEGATLGEKPLASA
jgi:methionyl-tRNA formyltransferase